MHHRTFARPAGRLLAATLVTALIAAAAIGFGAAPAQAAEWQPFTKVYSQNARGDIAIIGNTLQTCSTSGTNGADCPSAQQGINPALGNGRLKNNDFTAQYVDVDSDATTWNSSRATLTVPTDGSVLFAALVWSGRTPLNGSGNEDPAKRQNVRLTTPDGVQRDLVGSVAAAPNTVNPTPYQGYLDVTSIVGAAGSGAYTVANVQSSTGATDRYAGWALVVALGDPNAPARNLTVFKGFGDLNTTNSTVQNFTVSGFLTPPQGAVRTTLGVVSYEGDRGFVGDSLSIKGSKSATATQLSDPLNPANDVFNSTISSRGVDLGGRTPNYGNQLGMDADLLSADGLLQNGETSATLSLTTSSETYYPGVVTFATDLYDPKLNGTKSATLSTDVDGDGKADVGDTIRYTVDVRNDGLDSAVDSTLFDAVPTGTAYVPGSLTVDGSVMSDAAGDDAGEYVPAPNGHVVARIGAGATAANGGEIATYSTSSESHRITFDARITGSAAPGQQLTNAADIAYAGKTTGARAASVSNVTIDVVPDGPASTLSAPNRVLSFEPTLAQPSLTIDLLSGVTGGTGSTRIVGITDTAGGRLVLNPDGTVAYTPSPVFAGRDVFTYTAEDASGARSTGTVKVDVLDTAPTAVNDAAGISHSQPSTVNVIANDTDPNGDAISVYSVTANGTTIVAGQTATTSTGGTLQIDGGSIRYSPPAGGLAVGATEVFTYVPQDARGARASAPGTVTLTAGNTPPVAADDTLRTSRNATAPVTIDPRANDRDADGDALTISAVGTATRGTVSFTGTTVSYTPAPGYAGPDSFTYTVGDGHGSTATATVDVSVDGPPVAVADTFTAPGGATQVTGNVITAPGSSPNTADSDPNGDPLSLVSVGAPTVGSITSGPDGTVRYAPPAGFVGDQTVPYTITDGTTPVSSAVTFRVDNIAPTASSATATIPATTGGSIAVQSFVTDPNVAAGFQTFTTTAASGDRGATATINPDGTVTIVPMRGYTGPITLTYTVSDGVASVTSTVAITVSDNAPAALPDSADVATNGTVDVDALANDSDADGDPLTITVVGTPVDSAATPRGTATIVGGKVRYVPDTGWAGTVTIPYTISDGQATASSTITVTVDNANPVPAADSASAADFRDVTTTEVLGNDTDPNIPATGQTLSITSATADRGATVQIVGTSLRVTPAQGYRGPIAVDYTVSDGVGGSATGRLTVTVGDAPPVIVDPVVTSTGGSAVLDLLSSSSDPNGDPLAVTSVGPALGPDGLRHGVATLSGSILTITPDAGYVGTLEVAYTISDGQGALSSGTARMTVAAAGSGTAGTTAAAAGGPRGLSSSAANGRLATTGVTAASGLGLGAFFGLVGAVLLIAGRRRRRHASRA